MSEKNTVAEAAAAKEEADRKAAQSRGNAAGPVGKKKSPEGVFDPTDPAQTRSGGPRAADPDVKPPIPVHSPDLADNPPGIAPPPGRVAPRDITKVADEDDIAEMLRVTDKADVIAYWRRQERASAKPRESVVKALTERLRDIQGDPIEE